MRKIGFRHFLVFLTFLGIVITYMLRVNLSVAILAMVNNTALTEKAQQQQSNQSEISEENRDQCFSYQLVRDGPFLWDAKTRGLILGSFFYGYIVTELPGGWLSYRFGGKWVLGLGMLWTAVFTLLTPLTVHLDLPLLIVLRILEGLGEGFVFPCVHGLFAQWIPPSERGSMPSAIFASGGLGTVIAFPLSAALCNSEMGWPLVFYVFGVIGVIWFLIWAIVGSNSPATSRWISDEERRYIERSLEETFVKEERPSCSSVPWRSIAKSPAAWSVMVSIMSHTWGFYTLVTLLPTYFKDVLHMDLSQNGFYSALPYVCTVITSFAAGPIADLLIARHIFSVGTARKIMDAIGHTLPGIFLLLATAVGCNVTAAVVLMCLAVASEGFVGAGSFANNLDLAGRFAGVTFGIINTMSSVCGVVAPYVAGAITQYDHTIGGWRIVFGIAAGFYWLAAILFIVFGRGETADWALGGPNETVDSQAKTAPGRSKEPKKLWSLPSAANVPEIL